jgi:hypothetical protein
VGGIYIYVCVCVCVMHALSAVDMGSGVTVQMRSLVKTGSCTEHLLVMDSQRDSADIS